MNELTLQSNGGHLPGDQYLWLAARQFLAQKFPRKVATAVMQNMRKKHETLMLTSNFSLSPLAMTTVRRPGGFETVRRQLFWKPLYVFRIKLKKLFAYIKRSILARLKWSAFKLLLLRTSIRSLISQKNNFDTWKKNHRATRQIIQEKWSQVCVPEDNKAIAMEQIKSFIVHTTE